jgi:predicted negative regulator of RcsB-dependent stress response
MTAPKGFQTKSGNRAENVFEWIELHSRETMWAIVAVTVVAGGVLFYQKSQAAQMRNASVALDEAETSINSGNLPLAQSSLERLVKRYGDTPSGKVAFTLLAQVHYQKGEYQAGIDALKPLTTANDKYFTAGALNLAGNGYEQMKKYAEAADMYQKASSKAQYESDKAYYLSSAARVLLAAGKTADAKAIWVQLSSDPSGPGAAEARVRLGELEAKPVS